MRDSREAAKKILEEAPLEMKVTLFRIVGEALEKQIQERDLDLEEVLSFEHLEDIATSVVEHVVVSSWVLMEEHIPEEAQKRIIGEEEMRLWSERGEDSEDAIASAALKRMKEEYPQAFQRVRRRRSE